MARSSWPAPPSRWNLPTWVWPSLWVSRSNKDHINNFFDCMASRELPAADIEQGFRSTATVLLAGISLKVGRKLHWDGTAEQFINDDQANRHLARTYRAPWHL